MSGNNNQYGGFGGQMSGGVSYGGQDKPSEPTSEPKPAESLLDIGSSQKNEPVKDITTAEFQDEVINASSNTPVLIDFWAPWCGPCKQLAPALEKAVAKTNGRVKLVKMNIDDHPEIAGQMGIQSIPAVVAFVKGQPKDAFMGAKSEGEINQFIEKLVGPSGPSKLELTLEEAAALFDQEAYEQAARLYSAILSQQPENLDALAGYGMTALKSGNPEEAKKVLESVSDSTNHQGIEALAAAIALHEQAADLGGYEELQAQVEKDPANKEARFDLAIALNAAGKREEAADQLLEIIAKDRVWRDDGAKEQLLQFFEAWGPADATTLQVRRKLSAILFS